MDPIFLIIPDPRMVVGIQNTANILNLHLICIDNHPVLRLFNKTGILTFSLQRHNSKSNIRRTAAQILSQHSVLNYIQSHTPKNITAQILVFKPSLQVDNLCKKLHFTLLANPYQLNKQFEDKINFYQRLAKHPHLREHLLPHYIAPLGQLKFSQLAKHFSTPFVLQYGRGWAGNSTFLIHNHQQLKKLMTKWPNRIVKITQLITGPTLINNMCIVPNQVLVSPPAIQLRQPISNHQPLFATTLGRQWPAVIPKSTTKSVHKISSLVSEHLAQSGYRGYLGLDFIIDSQNHQPYLQECNARLTASFGFYTQLENLHSQNSLILNHIKSFSNINQAQSPIPNLRSPISGCQLSYRNLTRQPITIKTQLPTGLYQLQNQRLKFLESTLDLQKTNHDKFILLPPLKGSLISPYQLLYLINTLYPLANNQGHPTSTTQGLTRVINRSLSLQTLLIS